MQTLSFGQSQKDIDVIDIGRHVFSHLPPRELNPTDTEKKTIISILPAAGYTLQTGFAAVLSANAVFSLEKDTVTKQSFLFTNVTYSQYRQIIFPLQCNLWTKDNKYNVNTDIRFMKYPQFTYGLGGSTDIGNGYKIDYANIHVYETVMRQLSHSIYAGLGYNYDYYWNIHEIDPPSGVITDFQNYGITKELRTVGLTANALYDNRDNQVYPLKGTYAKVAFRNNFKFLGSDANWSSLTIDFRHYIQLSAKKDNVLAIWSYDWFTTSGTPPYLMLPSTGWDPYSNTGRGYIQGRFRGDNMLYLEAEYRFRIMNNGLVGGTVYSNIQSISEPLTNKFTTTSPGAGVGLRIKLNKFSKTNIAIDYAIGTQGSRGFWVNLGEVF
ncbi:MAG: BamA/TamA family outer membrane protein [Bacteroidetes bacterium]|nr:BamA/TamA family outer membrane protein [Bacteroidota bacterium]